MYVHHQKKKKERKRWGLPPVVQWVKDSKLPVWRGPRFNLWSGNSMPKVLTLQARMQARDPL